MTDPTYIQPAVIDHLAILADLRVRGWLDAKIETMCGFSRGHVHRLRTKQISNIAYFRAVRLYNFWVSELEADKLRFANSRLTSVTT